jgi:type VI secretion system protein VasG
VLLDEMEKAHPGVQDIFYQVFDKGMLRDGEGRDIDFKNTVIIMTSNAASEQISNLCEDPDTRPAERELLEAINPTLRETYKPAFLGRVNVVPYFPLDDNCLADIARIQLNLICQRVRKHYKAELVITENFVNSITQQCRTSDTGARQISALLNHGLLPQMAEVLLMAMSKEMIFDRIIVDINEDFSFDILLEEKKENIQIENEVNV